MVYATTITAIKYLSPKLFHSSQSQLRLLVKPRFISANISLNFQHSLNMAAKYTYEERGKLYTETYRIYLKNESGQAISPFHDIPLTAEKRDEANSETLYNMVLEVPRWTCAKMEISKSIPLNPITQDVKKGKVRFVGNVFPHRGFIWNYGAIPQTWEDPGVSHPDTNAAGDNDPLDVCDISDISPVRGTVIQVKVLGVLAMIDEGETDWKLIAINNADPVASLMHDIDDVEKYKPGLLHATVEWFKYYKVPDGKPKNAFAFNGRFKNKEFAKGVINETHEQWKKLMGLHEDKLSDEECKIARQSLSVSESPYLIEAEQAQKFVDESEPYDYCAAGVSDPKPFESFFINAAEIPESARGRVIGKKTARETIKEGDVTTIITKVTTTKEIVDGDGNTVTRDSTVVTKKVFTGDNPDDATEEVVVENGTEQNNGEANNTGDAAVAEDKKDDTEAQG